MKTRTTILAVVFLALFAASSVFAQTAPLYIKQFGSDGYDYDTRIVTDAAGNVYMAGMTHGVINAPQQVTNSNFGEADVFVAKLNAQGEILWVTQFGSTADDYLKGIALSNYNGVISLYVVGNTEGRMPGGQDSYVNAPAGGKDFFAAKIHPESGTVRWIRQYGSSGDDEAYGVACDGSGMVYVVGSTTGSLDGAANPGGTSSAFIMKIDAYGYGFGTYQFNVGTTPVSTAAYAVAVDSTSSSWVTYVYVTGVASGNEAGSLFVAKFDSYLGPVGSIATLGGRSRGSDYDAGYAIAVDPSGSIIVAGSTTGGFEGNVSQGSEDIVVAKLTSRLVPVWTFQHGTDASDVAQGIAIDSEGSIYITGATGFPVASRGLGGQTYFGSSDIFLSRLAPDGRLLFTRQLGTVVQDWGYATALDPSGNIYVAGMTDGTLGAQSFGLWDAVLIKYGPDGPVPPPVTEFFINGTVQETPSGTGLDGVSITLKDELGQVVGDYTTDSAGRFASKVAKAGKYFVHKLKIGYRAQVDPDVVEVSQSAPSAAPVAYMEKIVIPTSMAFRKGYNTVRFEKLPADNRSVNAVFGQYAGNPYVGLIFSFDRPMQFLILTKPRAAGNLKTIEFGRSYMIYTSRAFTIDTTSWVSQPAVPSTVLPNTKVRGKIQPY